MAAGQSAWAPATDLPVDAWSSRRALAPGRLDDCSPVGSGAVLDASPACKCQRDWRRSRRLEPAQPPSRRDASHRPPSSVARPWSFGPPFGRRDHDEAHPAVVCARRPLSRRGPHQVRRSGVEPCPADADESAIDDICPPFDGLAQRSTMIVLNPLRLGDRTSASAVVSLRARQDGSGPRGRPRETTRAVPCPDATKSTTIVPLSVITPPAAFVRRLSRVDLDPHPRFRVLRGRHPHQDHGLPGARRVLRPRRAPARAARRARAACRSAHRPAAGVAFLAAHSAALSRSARQRAQ